MLDINYIRKNIMAVKNNFILRGINLDIDEFIALDDLRKELLRKSEELKNIKNNNSLLIAKMKSNNQDTSNIIQEMLDISRLIKEYNYKITSIENKIKILALEIPNMFDSTVPFGLKEEDNLEIKKYGEIKNFNFEVKDHVDIAIKNDIIDFDRATKMSGSRFVLYKGLGAKLERALINFMLDIHSKDGYIEIMPPLLVKEHALYNSGQFPKFREDNFSCDDNLFLIPTSEVPLLNIHANEILLEEELPKLYTSYTPCFRKEAGSYGKDTKGIIRLHQFNKVELVKFVKPEESNEALETLLMQAEKILKLLELPYRVVLKCTGDTGFTASKTYDIEVWLPSQKKYREISSCSNVKDFQARRSSIKYRKEDKKTEYVHTLNGSGLAVGRTLAAILENYQNIDGTFNIPEVLNKYL